MRKTFIKKILREGLNLPYKNLSTPELWFKDLLNQMYIYESPQYPNTMFFHINNKIYMEYNKNFKVLNYDYYQIYSVLESKFRLNDYQINELVKSMVEKDKKLEINIANVSRAFSSS